MNKEIARTILSDVKAAYFLWKNENYKKRLREAYDYIKAEGVNSLEEFKKRKEKLLSTPNILGNNLYILLEEIDKEHEMLSKQYIETLSKETYNSKPVQSDFITHCPIKTKTRNI